MKIVQKQLNLRIKQIVQKINKIDIDSAKKVIKSSQKKKKKKKKILIKIQHRFKSERHNGITEEVDKIVLSSNDDKRRQ